MQGYYTSLSRLARNALRFRLSSLMGAQPKPEVLSLALTNRCNSHCIMCNIWKQSAEDPDLKRRELGGDAIIRLLSHPLFSELVELDLTGGEPHLRDDLKDIVLRVGRLKKDHLARLRSIIIASNGLMPRRILSNYRSMLEGLRGLGIDLITVNSLDGLCAIHDEIRGTPGAFNLALETIHSLRALRNDFPNYYMGIKATILPQNIHELDSILSLALQMDLFHIISPAFFTQTRFKNFEKKEELELRASDRERALQFSQRRELRSIYFYFQAGNTLATGVKQWVCGALYNYLFIDFDGRAYPCELISTPVGNIESQSPDEIWRGAEARSCAGRINKTDVCRSCTEPGAIRYSACAEGMSYVKFLRRLGKQHYHESLHGEGFDKYLCNLPAQ